MKPQPTDLDMLRGHRFSKSMRNSRVLDEVENGTFIGVIISNLVADVIDRRAKLEAAKRSAKS